MQGTSAPAISVVIPCCNCARYLGAALDSLLRQTLPPAEVVVVDDGSTDDSPQVARAHALPVTVLQQSNQGIGAARNAGAAHTRGEFLAFLDADDLWAPAKLAQQMAVMQSAPHPDAVFAHAQNFLSPDLADTVAGQRLFAPSGARPAYYASSLLIRRAAFDRVGGFAVDLRVGEFIDWYARAVDAHLTMPLLPEVLVWRRIHAANTSLRHRQQRGDYARLIKRTLDRRRAPPSASQTGQ